jgi:hypothetical protein
MNQTILNSNQTFVEGIRVVSRPLDADMGVTPLTPFVVSVSAETSNYDELYVDLYSVNSKSIPYTSELDNNWSALKAQWRFLDANGNIIEEKIDVDWDTEVVSVNESGDTYVRGGVGTATFYYVDDLPSDCGVPVMIQATLNTLNYYDRDLRSSDESITSFYNSKMTTIIPFQVYPIKPSFIHFSQNGAIDLYNLQWAGNNINGYATINGVPRQKFLDYEKCAVDYPIIFNSPKYESASGTNILEYSIYPLLTSEIAPSGSYPTSEFLPYEMASGIANGGWAGFDVAGTVETSGAMLSGNVDVVYDNADYACDATAEMWVSNSTANMIHKLQTTYIDSSNPELSAFYEVASDNISNNVYSTGFNVPFYDQSYYNATVNAGILSNIHELSGYSGVYGMAIDGDSNVWNIDVELDRIYKRDSLGNVLFTVDLQKQPSGSIPTPYANNEYSWYGPSSISLDVVGDAYVSLYNSPSAMKITSSGVIDGFFQPDAVGALPAEESEYFKAVDVETDTDGNVHVLFSNYEQSGLVKYDATGTQLAEWLVTNESQPVDMVYLEKDGVKNIYATLRGKTSGSPFRGVKRFIIDAGSYATTYANICLATDPTFITVDTNKNIWFAFDKNKVGVLTNTTSAGQGEMNGYINTFFEIPTDTPDLEVIGGLACDSSGFINILQRYSNIMYRLNADDFIATGNPSLYGIKINPEENYTIVKDLSGNIEKIPAVSGEEVSSLQAYGDWSGLIWDQKFGVQTAVTGSETVTLSGSSLPFEIKSFQNKYELRRQNDSWDMHEQIKSYILPDFQQGFTDLWDDLIGNTVGNDASEYQTVGRQFYEKIANFVLNHSDIHLANIDQVYSLFESMALEYENYDFNYPADLKHWMNILSIAFERLKGDQYQCNRNFKPKRYETIEECEVCGQIHPSNMGDEIPFPTMTVGEPVVIRDTYKSVDAFDVFYPPLSGDFQQLSDYYGYRTPFVVNYEVFEYIPTVSPNNQAEGFINWADPHNEIAISGIETSEWWEDGGYVEQIFTQILYGGLGLGAEFYTEEQAQNAFAPNIISDLGYDNTSFLNGGMLSSAFLVPIKAVACSPIAGYGIPFYTTNDALTGTAIPLGYDMNPVTSGLAVSDKFVQIDIDTDTYYAPSYIVEPSVLPVAGTGIAFEGGFVTHDFPMDSTGYLVFSSNGDKYLLPVYQAKSDI